MGWDEILKVQIFGKRTVMLYVLQRNGISVWKFNDMCLGKLYQFWKGRGKRNGKVVKLVQQLSLKIDMCDVEEIAHLCREELADRELIQLEESELCAKTEADTPEEPQEQPKLFRGKWTSIAFRKSAAGIGRFGKYTV